MFFAQALDQVTDLYDLFRVQAYRRLIQNDNLRISHQCLGQTGSLFITF